jgi:hypothetical protein
VTCSASRASILNVLNRGLRNLIKEYNSGLHIRSLKGMPRSESESIIQLFRDKEVGAGLSCTLW